MATVQSVLDSARYDLSDFETGLDFDDVELLDYMNRMIGLMDSALAAFRSDLIHGTETTIDLVEDQDYVELSSMNSGNWDSIRSVWVDTTKLTQISVDEMYYKRKWYSSSLFPYFWALQGTQIIFESESDRGWEDTVVPTNATNILTAASAITNNGGAAATGDGPYWIAAATTLANGLSASTDYYLIVNSTTEVQLATTAALAAAGTAVTFSDDGTGAHTLTERTGLVIHYNTKEAAKAVTDSMPYNDIFNEFLREMVVMHARAKKDGTIGIGESTYHQMFKKRAWEETIRRGFVPRPYYIDF